MGEICENRETDGRFYEIEYDSSPFPGVGKFVLKPQKIEEPAKDEFRELFERMREIARAERATYDYAGFFDRRVQHDNAVIMYKQGLFMKDIVDDYSENAAFSQYYPYYQMMGYKQLRTYFTWRTRVRKGIVPDISLSYAFLYIYELLGNIGVADPQEGLDRLMFFREAFGAHNKAIDKYVLRWLKDYHIYYDLKDTFKAFVEKHGLAGFYPKVSDLGDMDDSFELFCAVSKYDIRKSAFFADGNADLARDCFGFVMERIRQEFETAGMHFDSAFFRPTRRIAKWKPFKDALFHPWLQQPDRQVVLSENEIYFCRGNEWFLSAMVTSEKGKRFVGYVMKRMEMVLRGAMKYKFKTTANLNMVHDDTIRSLTKSGLFIENIVPAAVMDFYREVTKTVVTVDPSSLDRIRQEALVTQEALIVEERPDGASPGMAALPPLGTLPPLVAMPPLDQGVFADPADPGVDQDIFADTIDPGSVSDSLGGFEPGVSQGAFAGVLEPTPVSDGWMELKASLTENELQALAVVLQGGDIKAFADGCGVMLEVLADCINGKAMDIIGDSLMDEFVLYDEYKEQVKEMVR